MSNRAPLGAEELRQLIATHGSWARVAKALGMPSSTVRARASKFDIEPPSLPSVQTPHERETVETGRDTATAEFVEAVITPNEVLTDQQLLEKASLDAQQWEVVTRRTSVWEAQVPGGETKLLRSLRVSYGRVKPALSDTVLPAFNGSSVTVKAPARLKRNERQNTLVIVVSDFHAPYHDPKLLAKCEQVLLSSQPDRLIINGDLVDFPSVSRHSKTTLNCQASANECVQAGGEILGRLRAAVPADCQVQFVPGNHDAWLSNYLLRQAGDAAGLCAAGSDVPVWSLQNLLRFNELGIEMVGSEDQWQHAVVRLTDHLVVRHGVSVRTGSAASVVANMKSSEYASVTGHTHRMGLATSTRWQSNGKHKVVQGAEIGGMFKMPAKATDWPTYTPHNMDWQPGFASIEIEPDGHFSISLASWQNGVLMWRGERW